MNRPYRFFVPLCAVLFAFASLVSAQTPQAQPPQQPRMPEQNMPQPPDWERLSAAQREAIVAVVRERWNSNPRQRARMLQHAERWQRMTPEQRRSAQHGQRRWEQMSPEQRRQAREAFKQGRHLPSSERAALREKLKAMTPEQRREWLRTHRRQGPKSQ